MEVIYMILDLACKFRSNQWNGQTFLLPPFKNEQQGRLGSFTSNPDPETLRSSS